MNSETEIMQIIVYAGNAKSMAMMAIKEAKNGHMEEAKSKLEESDDHLKIAHQSHTELLKRYAENPEESTNMFMTHAQDHMMSAMTANDFAIEFIDLYGTVRDLTTTIKELTNK